MNWKVFPLMLIPGLCNIQHGRAGRGVLWFFLFAFFLNGFFLAPFLVSARSPQIVALVAAGVIWLLAFWDGVRCAARARTSKASSARAQTEEEHSYERTS